MQLGAMNNPYASVFKEIKAIAEMGFDYIDLTIESPGAAVESTDCLLYTSPSPRD